MTWRLLGEVPDGLWLRLVVGEEPVRGAPVVRVNTVLQEVPAGWQVCRSHGMGWTLLAAAEGPVGVDAEVWHAGVSEAVLGQASARERWWVRQVTGAVRRQRLLQLWTAKEAVFKWAGVEQDNLPEVGELLDGQGRPELTFLTLQGEDGWGVVAVAR